MNSPGTPRTFTFYGPALHRPADCEAVLRSVPQWFGIEKATQMYVQDSDSKPTFGIDDGTRLLGFLTLHEHFPGAWDVHCMAVHADARGQGIGTRLLVHVEAWLVGQGARWLQVKTVAAPQGGPEYAETRAFYAARGFEPLEVFPTLWDPWNPALQCIKRLPASQLPPA